jgi:para-aminobenzoate synthetase/4-amino-4-deoxychorismate lyase
VLAPPGSGEPRARFNVAIRTVVVDGAGNAEYGTGGGITWDSRPAGEYDEALVKAAVLTHTPAGFSLLETMRWTPEAGVVRRHRHLDRMRASADYFGFTFPAAAIDVRLDAITGTVDRRVRVLVDPAGQVTVETSPLVVAEDPVRLAIDTVAVDAGHVLLFHKTTDRAVYEEAAARHPGADDVVLVNGAGFATETTRANLAVRLGADWVTPPLEDGCLPGAYRAELLEEGTLREASIPATRLVDADELAVISSLHGWLPARLAGQA